MDDHRFDSLVKALAQGRNRRSLLKGMLGLGGAAVIGAATDRNATEAARRTSPSPTPVRCPGRQTPVNGVCTCPSGLSKCGPDCCNPGGVGAAHSECCDNACCFGTCYGEELCCPTNAPAGGGAPTHKLCGGICVDLRVDGACCDEGDCGDPCQVCNVQTHTCQARCGQGTVCCTEQAGPGVCVTGTCCPGAPCPTQGELCCTSGGVSSCIEAACCGDSDCDDNDACTTSSCQNGACVFSRVNCDDGNICTIDSCDPAVGCIHTPVDCDDGNVCHITSCNSAVGCIFTEVDCDDGNACTTERCDPDVGCIYELVNCDDGNPCTIDTCDPTRGCIHTSIDCSGVTDLAACVIGTCSNGACVAQSTCAPGTACCGDGSCTAECGCLEDGNLCSASSECCEGCCIANLSTFEAWEDICRAAGLIGTAATLCAQLIVEQGYPETCFFPNQIVLGTFPNNPVTLPCS